MEFQGAPTAACAAGLSTHQSRYFTRSKMVNGYKAAGILPWAVLNGVPFCLIGAEPRRTGPNGSLTRTMCKRPPKTCSPFAFSDTSSLLRSSAVTRRGTTGSIPMAVALG